MSSRRIVYTFNLPGKRVVFPLEYDSKTLNRLSEETVDYPDWTRLTYHKCPHCTLEIENSVRCPLAESIAAIVGQFAEVLSYHELDLEVEIDERIVLQKTTAQRALSSLLGLIMAVSGCPHTAFFKPMARFHLPLANEEETIYRASSMYLLAQYFREHEGKNSNYSLEGLEKIYKNMQIVNTSVVERLRGASKADSSVNAVIMLDMYARIIPYVIEDALEDVRYLFEPFFAGIPD